MIPTLLTATIVFVIAFIAAPPVHLFFIAALGSNAMPILVAGLVQLVPTGIYPSRTLLGLHVLGAI